MTNRTNWPAPTCSTQHPVDFDIFWNTCQASLAPDDLHETEEFSSPQAAFCRLILQNGKDVLCARLLRPATPTSVLIDFHDIGRSARGHYYLSRYLPAGCAVLAPELPADAALLRPATPTSVLIDFHDIGRSARGHYYLSRYLPAGCAVLAPELPADAAVCCGAPDPQTPGGVPVLLRTYKAALRALRAARQLFPHLPVAVSGEGLGGAMALLCAAQSDAVTVCTVLNPLLLDLRTMAGAGAPNPRRRTSTAAHLQSRFAGIARRTAAFSAPACRRERRRAGRRDGAVVCRPKRRGDCLHGAEPTAAGSANHGRRRRGRLLSAPDQLVPRPKSHPQPAGRAVLRTGSSGLHEFCPAIQLRLSAGQRLLSAPDQLVPRPKSHPQPAGRAVLRTGSSGLHEFCPAIQLRLSAGQQPDGPAQPRCCPAGSVPAFNPLSPAAAQLALFQHSTSTDKRQILFDKYTHERVNWYENAQLEFLLQHLA